VTTLLTSLLAGGFIATAITQAAAPMPMDFQEAPQLITNTGGMTATSSVPIKAGSPEGSITPYECRICI
jgi:hypothetical protein